MAEKFPKNLGKLCVCHIHEKNNSTWSGEISDFCRKNSKKWVHIWTLISLKMWSSSVDKSDFRFWEQIFFGKKKWELIFKAGISMQTCQGDFDFWWKNPEKFGWKSSQFRFYKGKQLFLFDFESTSFRNILEIWNSRNRVKAKSQQDFAIEPNFQKKIRCEWKSLQSDKIGRTLKPITFEMSAFQGEFRKTGNDIN